MYHVTLLFDLSYKTLESNLTKEQPSFIFYFLFFYFFPFLLMINIKNIYINHTLPGCAQNWIKAEEYMILTNLDRK